MLVASGIQFKAREETSAICYQCGGEVRTLGSFLRLRRVSVQGFDFYHFYFSAWRDMKQSSVQIMAMMIKDGLRYISM
jgi:hypothetical protein